MQPPSAPPLVSSPLAVTPEAEAEVLWQRWKARGAAADRQSAKQMRGVMGIIALAYIAWIVSLFV